MIRRMAHYLSSNPEQMKLKDEVYAALQHFEGNATHEELGQYTKQDLWHVLAAIEYLIEEGKIGVIVTRKTG
jgi:hypothetical protein